MTVGVLNDTITSKNFGCQLVSHSVRKYLEGISEITEIRYFPFNKSVSSKEGIDIVIVNGEGSLGHRERNPDGFKKLSQAIEEYSKSETPIYLVNFSFQNLNGPKKHIKLLRLCKKVAVREPLSYLNLKALGLENVQLFPDLGASYFEHEEVEKEFDIVFGLGSISKFIPKKSTELYEKYARVINKFAQDYRVAFLDFPANPASDLELMNKFLHQDIVRITGTFKDCYDGINKSKVLVTGRHHATIMGLIAKVPFVTFDSNMWKTEGNQLFYGPFSNFHSADPESTFVDQINYTLQNLDQATKVITERSLALKKYFTGHLDCVFEDINDPVQDGLMSFELTEKVRKRFSYINFEKYGF